MQNNNLTKVYTKDQLERLQLNNRIKVVMPDDVLDKIVTLCNVISRVEWSGILLYKTTGSIKRPEKMIITLKDIILMNKGELAYTEYNFNEKKRDQSGYSDRHIDYTNENEKAITEKWQIGHIHSHNNMKVFFSNTDMEELDENSPSHNFYLSLIVNNALDFQAKISFIAEAQGEIKTVYKALDEDGNEYNLGKTVLQVKKQKLFIYDCEIQSNKDKIRNISFFEKNISEVLNEPKFTPVITKLPQTISGNTFGVYNNNNNNKKFVENNKVINTITENIKQKEDLLNEVEYFTIRLLNGTNMPDANITFENFLTDLNIQKPDGIIVSRSVIENYMAVFESVFEDYGDQETFISITEDVISLLSDYENEYKFLTNTTVVLQSMLDKFLKEEEERLYHDDTTI